MKNEKKRNEAKRTGGKKIGNKIERNIYTHAYTYARGEREREREICVQTGCIYAQTYGAEQEAKSVNADKKKCLCHV